MIFRIIGWTYEGIGWKDGYFKTAAIGQEFVISESDDITNWAKKVILNNIDKGLS